MSWDKIAVVIILLLAVFFIARMLFRTLSGKESGCESCPDRKSCHFESTDTVLENLRSASREGKKKPGLIFP
jgi:hypothetical protein